MQGRPEVIKVRKQAIDGEVSMGQAHRDLGCCLYSLRHGDPMLTPDGLHHRLRAHANEREARLLFYAVETELTAKEGASLEAIMRAFRDDRQYASVFYAVGSDNIKRHIITAVKRVAMPMK